MKITKDIQSFSCPSQQVFLGCHSIDKLIILGVFGHINCSSMMVYNSVRVKHFRSSPGDDIQEGNKLNSNKPDVNHSYIGHRWEFIHDARKRS